MTPLCRNSQKRLEHKENQTKYRNMTRKPRSHVRILIYRTCPIETEKFCLRVNLSQSKSRDCGFYAVYTAISRKVVAKSARDNPERYCGWFLVHCFSNKFQRMARAAMDVCLRVLKESNKSRFDSYSVRNSVLIISHITFRDCRMHSFSDNLSRNSCISKCGGCTS